MASTMQLNEGKPVSRRIQPRQFLIAMALLVALVGVGVWSLFLFVDYRRELQTADAHAQAMLDALTQHVNRVVETNELLLQQVIDRLADRGIETYQHDFVEWERLRAMANLPQQFSEVAVVDAEGELMVSTRGFGPDMPSVSFVEPAIVAYHRDSMPNGLLIGPTVYSPVDDRPYLVFSRRLEDEEGQFLGVVGVGIRADIFVWFAESRPFGPRSAVSLIRDDGLVLIRRPMTPEAVRLRLSQTELFTEHLKRANEGRYDEYLATEGEWRRIYFRRLSDLPIVAVAGLSQSDALANWRRHAVQASVVVLSGLAAIGVLALCGVRYARREEKALRDLAESRAQEELLRRELDHRIKNLLAIIQSLVRQSARRAADKRALETGLLGRIHALAHAQDLLSAAESTDVDLQTLIQREMSPFADSRLSLDGQPVRIGSKAAVTLAMMLHELATNATKYGALSKPGGRVEISWRSSEDQLELTWTEVGGPPVTPPAERGFGIQLLESGSAHEFEPDVTLDFRPEGLRAEVTVKLPQPS